MSPNGFVEIPPERPGEGGIHPLEGALAAQPVPGVNLMPDVIDDDARLSPNTLEGLESVCKSSNLVSNVFVHPPSGAQQPTATIYPHERNLRNALSFGSTVHNGEPLDDMDLAKLCQDCHARKLVLQDLNTLAKKNGFKQMQMLYDVILTSEDWTSTFLVGIAMVSLSTGSEISVEVLSYEDKTYSHSFKTSLDVSKLSSTFETLASSIPRPIGHVYLSLPSFLTENEKKSIAKAIRAIPTFSEIWIEAFDNINTVMQGLNDVSCPQNELIIEIGPDAADARLVSTKVANDFCKTVEAEFISRDLGSLDVLAQFVDPALAALRELPTGTLSANNSKTLVELPYLKRVVVLHSSPDVVPSVIEPLRFKFQACSPTVEILVERNLARFAAAASRDRYRTSIELKDATVFNMTLLRVGIARADGFVSTVMKRHLTLPNKKTVMFTTSKDYQNTATIKVVVGLNPRLMDNMVIAELILIGLRPRSKGVPHIEVAFDVDVFGETEIVAEEVVEQGGIAGPRASIKLKNVVGTRECVEDILARSEDVLVCKAAIERAAQESEDRWAGEEVQGDLPE